MTAYKRRAGSELPLRPAQSKPPEDPVRAPDGFADGTQDSQICRALSLTRLSDFAALALWMAMIVVLIGLVCAGLMLAVPQ